MLDSALTFIHFERRTTEQLWQEKTYLVDNLLPRVSGSHTLKPGPTCPPFNSTIRPFLLPTHRRNKYINVRQMWQLNIARENR